MRFLSLGYFAAFVSCMLVACGGEETGDEPVTLGSTGPVGGIASSSKSTDVDGPVGVGPASGTSDPVGPTGPANVVSPAASSTGGNLDTGGSGGTDGGGTGGVPQTPSAEAGNGGSGPMPSPSGTVGEGGEAGSLSVGGSGVGGAVTAGASNAGGMAGEATTGGNGGSGNESACSREVTEANKAVVRQGITEVFINGNGSVIDDYWADPYLQHNPIAQSGVDTFKSFFSNVGPDFYSLTRLIGECDKVLIHGSYSGSGATFDMLRVENDHMVEHWDAAIGSNQPNESGHTPLDGPTEVEDIELTGSNRGVVIGFVDDVMIDGNMAAAEDYLAQDLTEHAVGGSDGSEAFVQRVSDGGISYSTIHHQIAEGNFVFTLSEGQAGGTAYGFWDLFRVADGMIVEHWGARLEVQAGASGLGIF